MMWGTIANFKENLNKIALDVHDDDDEEILSFYAGSPAADATFSDRRNSHGSAHSKSAAVRSRPLANGTDHAHPSLSEMEQYRAEIKRLQASEAEIKALSVNYAALLKEKEDQIVRLNKENGSLKQNLEATNGGLRVSRTEASTNGTYSVKADLYICILKSLHLEIYTYEFEIGLSLWLPCIIQNLWLLNVSVGLMIYPRL